MVGYHINSTQPLHTGAPAGAPDSPGEPLYVGIDPGASGGMVALDAKGKVVQYTKMPETDMDIWQWIRGLPVQSICVIEKVGCMPGEGVSSAFKFGKGYGGLLMALTARGLRYEPVTPQRWIKATHIPPKQKSETRTQWKNRLKAKAQQLFPSVRVTLAISDALLIAEFCRKENQ